MSAIDVAGLSKSYGGINALNDLSLSLDGGQIVGLLGENGCGKTTLLKVLAAVLSDYTGRVRIHGSPPGPQSKAQVSFLPDREFLHLTDSVERCLDLYRHGFSDFNESKARDLLGFFGIDTARKINTLSKGMREKVQIALVMSRDARVFLLDEPISGVDPAARDTLLEAIVRDLNPEALVLVSTHLIHDLEPILDRIVMMRAGVVLLEGQVDDLRDEHGTSIDTLFRKVYR